MCVGVYVCVCVYACLFVYFSVSERVCARGRMRVSHGPVPVLSLPVNEIDDRRWLGPLTGLGRRGPPGTVFARPLHLSAAAGCAPTP